MNEYEFRDGVTKRPSRLIPEGRGYVPETENDQNIECVVNEDPSTCEDISTFDEDCDSDVGCDCGW